MYLSTIEYISPETAQTYLAHNTKNRNSLPTTVDLYAADMAAGKWTTCTEPVDFDEDGVLIEGQHRLKAIVKSGKGQFFTVNRGVPRADSINNGRGRPRSVVDNARLSGLDPSLTILHVAIANAVCTGQKTVRKSSMFDKMALVESHREAIDWAIKYGPKGDFIRNAVVLGAIARAWYFEKDKEKLARFCEVLQEGVPLTDPEHTPKNLRDQLLSRSGVVTNLPTQWREYFLKVQNCAWHYMRGKRLNQIKVIGEERYPLK